MKCKNCGNDLVGMEHACPMCGAPLPTIPPQQIPMQQMQMPVMPNYQMNPVLIPLEEVQQTVNAEVPEETVEQPKSDNKIFAIILGIVALAAIVVGIFLIVLGNGDEEEASQSISNKIVYAGYEFTLPFNYTGKVKDGLGLTVKDPYDNRYTILIDYTNKYEAYKASFKESYPTQIDSMTVNLSDREFLSLKVGDVAANTAAAQYVTSSGDLAVAFVGFIVRNDFAAPSTAEFEVLNTILNTAEKKEDINVNSKENLGREGIKLPAYNQADFDF